jgi:hypothetical protein
MQTLANSSICGSEASLRHGHKDRASAMEFSSAGDLSLAGAEAAATTVAQGTPMGSKLAASMTGATMIE